MIGKKIKVFRNTLGISQLELALAVKMTHDKICKIETGKRRVTATELPLFADALGIPVSELLDDNCNQAPTGTDS